MSRIFVASFFFTAVLICSFVIVVTYGEIDDGIWRDVGYEEALSPALGDIDYIEEGNYKYTILSEPSSSNGTVSIVLKGGTNPIGELEIPDTITNDLKTYNIVAIGANAFKNCSGLTSVTIPTNVINIGNYAFRNCSGLTSVTIPTNVTNIGNYAFDGCSRLTSIELGNVGEIGICAFRNCSGLTSVTIPSSVTIIYVNAFSGCTRLTSATILGDNVTIYDSAFSNCIRLTSVDFSGKTAIGNSAFKNCSRLTSVTIPDTIWTIGTGAFEGCTGLTDVDLRSVKSIEYGAFYGCTGLASVTISDNILYINDGAFTGCSGLTSVTVTVTDWYPSVSNLLSGSLGTSWNLPGQIARTVRTMTIDTEEVLELSIATSIDGRIINTSSRAANISINGTQLRGGETYVCTDDSLIEAVTVLFDLNDITSTPNTQVVGIGHVLAEPESVARAGYEFRGWYLDDVRWDFDAPVSSDMCLVAHWTMLLQNKDIVNDEVNADTAFILSMFAVVIVLFGVVIVIQKR